jgi:hypothetical protein
LKRPFSEISGKLLISEEEKNIVVEVVEKQEIKNGSPPAPGLAISARSSSPPYSH